jgi:hypothetical protein
MALMQSIVSQPGPLPIKNQFAFEGQGDVILFVSGSGWSPNTGQKIAAIVYIDGIQVAEIGVYTNESGSHKAMIPVMAPYNLPYAATHTVSVVPAGNTSTDVNDTFYVAILY